MFDFISGAPFHPISSSPISEFHEITIDRELPMQFDIPLFRYSGGVENQGVEKPGYWDIVLCNSRSHDIIN